MLSDSLVGLIAISFLLIQQSGLVVATCVRTPRVHVLNGTYAGEHYAELDQDIFRGLPFAQPPVGELRLEVPRSLNTSWQGVRNATTFSPSCVGDSSNAWGGDTVVSEDCLTLNVVRPSRYGQGDKLPVVIWIYGGGFRSGGSALAAYNQSWIVDQSVRQETPIIAVSINYRLAAFGWLWSKEVEVVGASNLGLRDQRLAMAWVQENIAAFGGDPKKGTTKCRPPYYPSLALTCCSYNSGRKCRSR